MWPESAGETQDIFINYYRKRDYVAKECAELRVPAESDVQPEPSNNWELYVLSCEETRGGNGSGPGEKAADQSCGLWSKNAILAHVAQQGPALLSSPNLFLASHPMNTRGKSGGKRA